MSNAEVWHIAQIVLRAKKEGKPDPSDCVWLSAQPRRWPYFLAVLNDLR